MRIVIVGDGKVGLTLTKMLSEDGHEITVIDSNPKVLERTQQECDTLAIVGHGAAKKVLEEAEVGTADLHIAATSQDEINLLSCLVAKKLGCKATIARVRNPEYAEDLAFIKDDLGLSYVINPEEGTACEIFNILQIPSFLARESFSNGRTEIVKIKIEETSPLAGVALTELYHTIKVRVLVCAADRGGTLIIPKGNFTIQKGDSLYIAAGSETLAALVRQLSLARYKITQVTIVGGSRIAVHLARLLIKSGVGVKIIENNCARSEYLADLVPGADIVEADGTDNEVLLSEGIDRSDALVALTGIDEENIVLSMYARQLGIQKIITKCNRFQYSQMLDKVGIDSVVSPVLTSVEQIVRYVRSVANADGGEMLTMHQIAGGKAETLEFIADSSAQMLDTPLKDIHLKENVLIVSIVHRGKLIMPSGDSIIRKGDNVIIITPIESRILDLNDILAN